MGLLLLAAARGIVVDVRPTALDEQRGARRARRQRIREPDAERTHEAPVRHRRVAGRRRRARGHSQSARAGAPVSNRAGSHRARAGNASNASRTRARDSNCTTSGPGRAAARARAGGALRCAAADARRSDARARAPRPSSATSGSTPNGPSSRCSRSSAPYSTRSRIRTSASARATSPISSAGSR